MGFLVSKRVNWGIEILDGKPSAMAELTFPENAPVLIRRIWGHISWASQIANPPAFEQVLLAITTPEIIAYGPSNLGNAAGSMAVGPIFVPPQNNSACRNLWSLNVKQHNGDSGLEEVDEEFLTPWALIDNKLRFFWSDCPFNVEAQLMIDYWHTVGTIVQP